MDSVTQSAGGEGRRQRGIELFRDAAFERVSKSPEVWIVESTYGSINEVELDRGTCSCRDFEIHGRTDGFSCKHLTAARLKSRKLAKDARELSGYFGGEAA